MIRRQKFVKMQISSCGFINSMHPNRKFSKLIFFKEVDKSILKYIGKGRRSVAATFTKKNKVGELTLPDSRPFIKL